MSLWMCSVKLEWALDELKDGNVSGGAGSNPTTNQSRELVFNSVCWWWAWIKSTEKTQKTSNLKLHPLNSCYGTRFTAGGVFFFFKAFHESIFWPLKWFNVRNSQTCENTSDSETWSWFLCWLRSIWWFNEFKVFYYKFVFLQKFHDFFSGRCNKFPVDVYSDQFICWETK